MSEIDLVPPRYRRRMLMRRWLMRAGLVYAIAACSLLGARAALSYWATDERRQLENLHEERQREALEQRRITDLETEREALTRRLEVLEGLRGGVAAKSMFAVIDRALDANIWFRLWTFRRAGQIINEKSEAVETGYFIVLPKESSDEPDRAWRFATHMEISAEARDHAALARFVRRLAEQREIEAARILNTRVRQQLNAERVDFDLAVSVRSAG